MAREMKVCTITTSNDVAPNASNSSYFDWWRD